jgi:Flp pilus assembly pilin Flp
MTTLIHLLDDRQGTVFVKYSSLALLIAIAAIAVLGQTNGHFLN